MCCSWWWYLCQFRILNLVARFLLLCWFKFVQWWVQQYCSPSVDSFEDHAGYNSMCRAIGLAVLSGMGRCNTHPGRWIHLPFHGHWPYWLRSNNCSCSRTNALQLSTFPRCRFIAESLPSYHMVLKLACVCNTHIDIMHIILKLSLVMIDSSFYDLFSYEVLNARY